MTYRIDSSIHRANPHFVLAGCGGTGAFLAEGLCRLLQGHPGTIVLVDPDRVEHHNLLRQNFLDHDVGRIKSQALAERLAKSFNRTIAYSVHPFAPSPQGDFPGVHPTVPLVLLGCVDNAPARQALARCTDTRPNTWYIDAGNDSHWGQILIGNTVQPDLLQTPVTGDLCYRLPAPTLQRPDILTQVPTTSPDIDCAAALDLTDQDPTINFTMAAHMLNTVHRFLAGTCTFMSLHLDTDLGTVNPHYITPEAIARFHTLL